MAAYRQADVQFYEVFFDVFWRTCLCVAETIMNIQEYSKQFQQFSSLLDVYFRVNRSEIKILSTEKNFENPRNSA